MRAVRCSLVEAFSDTASLGRTGSRPNSWIRGTMPDVEIVMRPRGISTPRGSAKSLTAFITWPRFRRSEEHTSELQSLAYLVCRLLLEKKKKNKLAMLYE